MPGGHPDHITPLAAKLGVKPGLTTAVVGAAPQPVIDALGDVSRHPRSASYDVIISFCPDRAALDRHSNLLGAKLATAGALWLCWPKKASGVVTDIGEADVRSAGLDTGLVDVKIAAIDEVWSGLKFVRRLADR